MSDPRIAKLPKWAQHLLVDARMRELVRFPDEPKPAPDFLFDANGWEVDRKGVPENTTLYQPRVAIGHLPHIYEWHFGNRYLHRGSDFGSRPEGPYFLTLERCRLYLRHCVAEKAAEAMLHAETTEPEKR